jgi:biotin carboxylase
VAALLAERLGLAHNDPMASEAARNKFRMRTMLASCGAAVPAFSGFRTDDNLKEIIARAEEEIGYPCVVKPEELNGSRGVIRADLRCELAAAVRRLTSLIGEGQPFLIEGYIPGVEVALEGLIDRNQLHCLALFDKPDPLVGPYFEETIYVTPSRLPQDVQSAIVESTEKAARGLGLQTGPIHAELRINENGPWIVEVAGRSIGGLCSRILRFGMEVGNGSSLEELILRQASGLPLDNLERESQAGGVMMIPIPAAGILRSVNGVEEAKGVAGIEEVQITARLDQSLVPLPEGDAYLGFIFARGQSPALVEESLRQAHSFLQFEIAPEFALIA